jgi:beta-lactamase regulating signal transducer with metallopeptidase domain
MLAPQMNILSIVKVEDVAVYHVGRNSVSPHKNSVDVVSSVDTTFSFPTESSGASPTASSAEHISPTPIESRQDSGEGFSLPFNFPDVAIAFWLIGASFMFIRLAISYRRLLRLKADAIKLDDGVVHEIIAELRQRMLKIPTKTGRMTRDLEILASERVACPISFGITPTTIILPKWILNDAKKSELEPILAHELAHIKRYDYIVNLLQRILEAIFFFHPLFHLASCNLTREREHICDDWVIFLTQKRKDYAACLTLLLEEATFPQTIFLGMAMMNRQREIMRRIEMILSKQRKIQTTIHRKTILAILLAGCFLMPLIAGIRVVQSLEEDTKKAYTNSFKISDGDLQKAYSSFKISDEGLRKAYTSFKISDEGLRKAYTSFKINDGDLWKAFSSPIKISDEGLRKAYTSFKISDEDLQKAYTSFKISDEDLQKAYTSFKINDGDLRKAYTSFKFSDKDLWKAYTSFKFSDGDLMNTAKTEKLSEELSKQAQEINKLAAELAKRQAEAAQQLEETLAQNKELMEKLTEMQKQLESTLKNETWKKQIEDSDGKVQEQLEQALKALESSNKIRSELHANQALQALKDSGGEMQKQLELALQVLENSSKIRWELLKREDKLEPAFRAYVGSPADMLKRGNVAEGIFRLQKSADSLTSLRYHTIGSVKSLRAMYLVLHYAEQPSLILKLPPQVGGEWTGFVYILYEGDIKGHTVVESTTEKVETPAGIFENCLKVKTTITGVTKKDKPSDAFLRGTRTIYFASGVGLVKLEYQHETGHRTEIVLVEYAVQNDTSYFPLDVDNTWTYRWEDGYFAKEEHFTEVWTVKEQEDNVYTIHCAMRRPPKADE